MKLRLRKTGRRGSLAVAIGACILVASCEPNPASLTDAELAVKAASLLSPEAPGTANWESFAFTKGKPSYAEPVGLTGGSTIEQTIPNCGPLIGVRLQAVSWGKVPSSYSIVWSLEDASGAAIGEGTIETGSLVEWQYLNLSFPETTSAHLKLRLAAEGVSPNPIGFPVGGQTQSDQKLLQDGAEVRLGGALEMGLMRPPGRACGEAPLP